MKTGELVWNGLKKAAVILFRVIVAIGSITSKNLPKGRI